MGEKISKHYGVLCKDFENIDARMNKKEYIPVFYDKSLLQGVQSIGIKTGSLTHSCMAVFSSKFTNKYFSVVNLDLYSANETTTDVQFSKILKVTMDSDFYKFPIFITGTINAISYNLNRLMHTTFRNIYDLDIGNVGLNKSTFHNHGKINDGVQRDFILLKNQPGYFFDLHSRILSHFPEDNLDHYPVYLSFRNNPANPQIKY